MTVPNLLPLCQHLSTPTQDNTGNKDAEEVTARDMTNIRANLRRVEDLMKVQKTKNLSNKNKECTSIAGAIMKLIERQDLGGMAASILMMLMRQLEALNNSMDKQEERERKREE